MRNVSILEKDIMYKVYDKICTSRKKRSFGRLYFDLLYLQLFNIKGHFRRVSNVIKNYSYDCSIGQKRNLIIIMNGFKEYPEEHLSYFDIKELINNINSNWLRDLDCQKSISPTKIYDTHIALSISNTCSKLKSYNIAKEIVKYCSDSTMLKQQILFKTATEILNNEDFEFWK